MDHWLGVVVAESLDDRTIINRFAIDKIVVPPPFEWPMCTTGGRKGVVGRWHLYRVLCAADDAGLFQSHIQPGWYAHFWKDKRLVVVFSDARFEVIENDRTTWKPAIEHGKRHGIPERMLDFKSI